MAWPVRSVLALISLPLFTVCAFTLYYYHTKDREWKRYLQTIQKQELELSVPLDCVGRLIGRGGQNIRDLQELTQTKINLRNSGNDDEKVRICRVFGTKENVELAKTKILEIIEPKDIEKYEMFVPKNICGKIIGRCGDNIRTIKRISNAHINFGSSTTIDDQVPVTIQGKAKEIDVARKLIEEKMAEIQNQISARIPRFKSKHQKGYDMENPSVQIPKFEKLPMTTADSMTQVYVSSVASPSHFWLQLISPRAVELDHLVDDMTDFYSKPENESLYKLNEVKTGQIVASKFQHDGKWYRVEVFAVNRNEENPDESVIDVFYVDYGDSAFYQLGDLLELKPEFLRLKFQAVEAALSGVLPKDNHWSEESIEVFSDMVHLAQWKVLLAQVVCYKETDNTTRKEPIPFVRLYDPDGSPGMDIGLQLVEKGLGLLEVTDEPTQVEDDDDDV